MIALINDPWFIFFIMSYKFIYDKKVRVTQFNCPYCKLDCYFDFGYGSISNRLYDLMNLSFYNDKLVDCRGTKKSKNKSIYHVKGLLGHCSSFNDMFQFVAGYMIHDIPFVYEKHFADICSRKIDDEDKIKFPKNESFICIDETQK